MDATEGRTRILALLDESVCRDTDIEFVVAFGSQLFESPRPTSDLDLAVKFDPALSAHERFEKRCFLSGDLQRPDAPFVDVSDIETLPLAVAHEAVQGQFLCGDEAAFHRFKADIEEGFEASSDDIQRHQRELIDRIAEEGLRG